MALRIKLDESQAGDLKVEIAKLTLLVDNLRVTMTDILDELKRRPLLAVGVPPPGAVQVIKGGLPRAK
jgi:hypothetical protein